MSKEVLECIIRSMRKIREEVEKVKNTEGIEAKSECLKRIENILNGVVERPQ